jgi:hypothetical protein
MIAIEREHQGEHRIPSIGVARHEQVTVDRLRQRALDRLVRAPRVDVALAHSVAQRIVVEHQDHAVNRARHEVLRELREATRRDVRTGFEQHLKPRREARRVERLALAGSIVAKEIFIKRVDELLGGRERDELARVLDADVTNEARERSRGQALDRLHEIRRVDEASEQRRRARREGKSVVHDGLQNLGIGRHN